MRASNLTFASLVFWIVASCSGADSHSVKMVEGSGAGETADASGTKESYSSESDGVSVSDVDIDPSSEDYDESSNYRGSGSGYGSGTSSSGQMAGNLENSSESGMGEGSGQTAQRQDTSSQNSGSTQNQNSTQEQNQAEESEEECPQDGKGTPDCPFYDADGTAYLGAKCTAFPDGTSIMREGECLLRGRRLTSPNGSYSMEFRQDNTHITIEIKQGSTVKRRWKISESNYTAHSFRVSGNGEFGVSSAQTHALGSSGAGFAGNENLTYVGSLENNGEFVIRQGGQIHWRSSQTFDD